MSSYHEVCVHGTHYDPRDDNIGCAYLLQKSHKHDSDPQNTILYKVKQKTLVHFHIIITNNSFNFPKMGSIPS